MIGILGFLGIISLWSSIAFCCLCQMIQKNDYRMVYTLALGVSLVSVLTLFSKSYCRDLIMVSIAICLNLLVIIVGIMRFIFLSRYLNLGYLSINQTSISHNPITPRQTNFIEAIIDQNLDKILKTYNIKNPQLCRLRLHFITIFLTFCIFLCSALVILLWGNLLKLISEQNLGLCLLIPIASLGCLFVIDRFLKLKSFSEVARRKLFHLGPIITIPIVNSLNSYLLLLILLSGFYLFLVLEILRYYINKMHKLLYEIRKDVYLSQAEILSSSPLGSLQKFFVWMETFNTRQKEFWFTHLFLILSLLIPIQLKKSDFNLKQVSEYISLVLIAADAMAAIAGLRFGTVKIYKQKSWIGCLAFLITFLIGQSVVEKYSGKGYGNFAGWVLIGTVCSFLEVFSGNADNIVTLFGYYLCCILIF